MRANSGKEVRRVFDVVTLHVRALKAEDQDSFDTLLTVLVEAKLENSLKLEWMKYSNEYKLTPPYSELLKFLDTQAQHSESLMQPGRKQYTEQKPAFKPRTSYMAMTENRCPLCKATRHPLYACRVFQRLSHDEKLKKVKEDVFFETRKKTSLRINIAE